MSLILTPGGRLVLREENRDLAAFGTIRKSDDAFAEELRAAFELSSADGLLRLAVTGEDKLPTQLAFWRHFTQLWLRRLSVRSENDFSKLVKSGPRSKLRNSDDLQPPDEFALVRLIESAPPMTGLEYLSTDVLRSLWEELKSVSLSAAADHKDGAVAWLQAANPQQNLLGRVTFHLAENKRDADRPFAFLATYVHQISKQAKLQHLPLAEALKQYAGEGNSEKMAALLKPVKAASVDSKLVQELLTTRRLFQPHALSINDAHRFLTSVPAMEQAGLAVRVPDWWRSRRSVSRPEVRVTIGKEVCVQGAAGLVDFSADLCLDGESLTDEERQQILNSSGGLMMLRGKWVEVDSEKLQEALDHWSEVKSDHIGGLNFIDAMRQLSGVANAESDDDDDEQSWSTMTAGTWLLETLQQLRDPSQIDDCQPGQDLQATLRPYQADGVRWMWFMTRLGMGAILADDMGLGKTIQVIDLLLMLRRQGSKRRKSENSSLQPSLLVVPASLIGNWVAELSRFAPSLKVTVVHRSECSAEMMRTLKESPEETLGDVDVVITTYGLTRRLEWLQDLQWNLVVLDEAQAIKNAKSARGKAVRKLKSSGRIALSGTPIENHLGELWSLFDFCTPGLLGSAAEFKKYAKKISSGESATAYAALRQLVRPYMLRRQKTDPNIAPDLPAKTEMRTEAGLSKTQVVLYERVLKELKERLDSSEGIARSGVVLGTLMQLKQICNHPDQFLKQNEYDEKASGKFQRLATICQPIRDRQERLLVFTQFQSLTEPLADFLSGVFGRSGLVLHGGVAVKKRKKLVEEFQADDGPPFFVISVKAGGTGLNLTAASHVVHFDRWWNPAVENQATDRAFRIGQKRNVLVHKFVCRGTVEERIDTMIQAKQELADEVLSEGAEKLLTEMSDNELLKFVAIDRTRAEHEE